ncbi:hypothetical protein [Bacillus piscicola]|uniref:hypothetical protein n=1 Tax=Bacillus piscicola TaxID=1632684 RepID=UPI001F0A024A|nr:hypothetical protein [Bacillus piscicola]
MSKTLPQTTNEQIFQDNFEKLIRLMIVKNIPLEITTFKAILSAMNKIDPLGYPKEVAVALSAKQYSVEETIIYNFIEEHQLEIKQRKDKVEK